MQKGWNRRADCPDGEEKRVNPAAADNYDDDHEYHHVTGEDYNEEEEEEEEEWDIDTDASTDVGQGTDSGLGPSEYGDSGSSSPVRRVMSLLNS